MRFLAVGFVFIETLRAGTLLGGTTANAEPVGAAQSSSVSARLAKALSPSEHPPVERPPQFVALAFDGSKSISMWRATREFAKAASARVQAPVRFTYFISSVYYMKSAYRAFYLSPGHQPGSSAIGWGGNSVDLEARIDQTGFAFEEKHEIASHAAGHFDGSQWSEADWRNEFHQFFEMIFRVFELNPSIRRTQSFPQGWRFKPDDVVGFRAPQLGTSDGLWPVLAQRGFRYDTSRVAAPTRWPRKDKYGVWNFPLARLTIAGTARATLSMDYNFYVADSAAQSDPVNSQLYRQRMLATYRNYFLTNYLGNRAPVHIGHHFSLWNDGAYWEAFKDFAEEVCGLPEVICGTYAELADFLESQPEANLRLFELGRFDKREVTLNDPPALRQLAQRVGNSIFARTFDLSWTTESLQRIPGTARWVLTARLQGVDVQELVGEGQLSIQQGIGGQSASARLEVSRESGEVKIPLTSEAEDFLRRTIDDRFLGGQMEQLLFRVSVVLRDQSIFSCSYRAKDFIAFATMRRDQIDCEEDKALIGDPVEAHLNE